MVEQLELPRFSELYSRAAEKSIPVDAEIDHLTRQFLRWGKYKTFSKDPEFRKRCEYQRTLLIQQMTRKRDGR